MPPGSRNEGHANESRAPPGIGRADPDLAELEMVRQLCPRTHRTSVWDEADGPKPVLLPFGPCHKRKRWLVDPVGGGNGFFFHCLWRV